MQNTRLNKSQAGIKIPRRNINSPRYEDDRRDEKLKSLLVKVKEEREKTGFKPSFQKTKIVASSFIT